MLLHLQLRGTMLSLEAQSSNLSGLSENSKQEGTLSLTEIEKIHWNKKYFKLKLIPFTEEGCISLRKFNSLQRINTILWISLFSLKALRTRSTLKR